MKLYKKIVSSIVILVLLVGIIFTNTENVKAAGLSISVNSSSVNVGGSVKVTVSIPAGYGATVAVSYDSSILTYSSCSVSASANAGTVVLNIGDAMGYSNSATISFKAASAGTANVSAQATVAGNADGDSVDISGASKTVTVNNAVDANTNNEEANAGQNNASTDSETAKLSSDSSLKSLVLSAGDLSPAFSAGMTNYTASVPFEVTKIAITAVPNNAAAKVISVSGNDNLEVGNNTVIITVKAENGVTTAYTILVTRQEEVAQGAKIPFEVNGTTLYTQGSIPQDIIPVDFQPTTISINGEECNCLSFTKGDIVLLYLGTEDGSVGGLYVYDSKQGSVYPFIKISAEIHYIIALIADSFDLEENYNETTLAIEGKGIIPAYQSGDNGLYLIYAMNDLGNTRWYSYDSEEGTFQRYVVSAINTQVVEEELEDDTQQADVVGEYQREVGNLEQKIRRIYVFGSLIIIILVMIIVALILMRIFDEGKCKKDKKDIKDKEDKEDKEDTDVQSVTKNACESPNADIDEFDDLQDKIIAAANIEVVTSDIPEDKLDLVDKRDMADATDTADIVDSTDITEAVATIVAAETAVDVEEEETAVDVETEEETEADDIIEEKLIEIAIDESEEVSLDEFVKKEYKIEYIPPKEENDIQAMLKDAERLLREAMNNSFNSKATNGDNTNISKASKNNKSVGIECIDLN